MDRVSLINILGAYGSNNRVYDLFKNIQMGSRMNPNLFSFNSDFYDFISNKEKNEIIMDSYSKILKDIDSIEISNTSIYIQIF